MHFNQLTIARQYANFPSWDGWGRLSNLETGMVRKGVAETSATQHTRRALLTTALAGASALLAGCAGTGMSFNDVMPGVSGAPPDAQAPPPQGAEGQSAPIGGGRVKVGLILPLTASGNAGYAGQSMRSAAELALAEFNNPDIQLLVKDDGGSAQGAQQAAQQVLV